MGRRPKAVRMYHGTRAPLDVGDTLLPRAQTGASGTTAPTVPGVAPQADAADHVHFTTDLDVAWAYAWHATPTDQAPRVLTLFPLAGVEADPEHNAAMSAYRCPTGARVLAVSHEPTVTEQQARSGWRSDDPVRTYTVKDVRGDRS